MTAGEWMTLGFGSLALIGGWVGLSFRIGRWTETRLAAEREARDEQIAQLREDFLRDQKSQDHNFGEVGAAMREKVATVEKEMHQIEIWSRDNFVRIENFDELRADLKVLAKEINSNFQELHRKIDSKQ